MINSVSIKKQVDGFLYDLNRDVYQIAEKTFVMLFFQRMINYKLILIQKRHMSFFRWLLSMWKGFCTGK